MTSPIELYNQLVATALYKLAALHALRQISIRERFKSDMAQAAKQDWLEKAKAATRMLGFELREGEYWFMRKQLTDKYVAKFRDPQVSDNIAESLVGEWYFLHTADIDEAKAKAAEMARKLAFAAKKLNYCGNVSYYRTGMTPPESFEWAISVDPDCLPPAFTSKNWYPKDEDALKSYQQNTVDRIALRGDHLEWVAANLNKDQA